MQSEQMVVFLNKNLLSVYYLKSQLNLWSSVTYKIEMSDNFRSKTDKTAGFWAAGGLIIQIMDYKVHLGEYLIVDINIHFSPT